MTLRTLTLLLICIGYGDMARSSDLRAGAAAVVITPPEGAPMAGYYQLRKADGVLDDLHAKAVVFEQDGKKAALVTLDLITVTRPVVVEARRLISEQLAIAPENVMISATHSHTGPVLTRGGMIDELTGGTSDLAQGYSASLPSSIARAVAEANKHLNACAASATSTAESRISFNRRFWMSDGTVAWNPAKLSPGIVAPTGPIDPEIGILHLAPTDPKQPSIATYVNFAMHPDVVGGTRISADYPGVLSRQLAMFRGESMVTLFANGCCGNINHRNVWWGAVQSGPAEAGRLGTALAGSVLASWPALKPVVTSGPRALSQLVSLPLPTFSDAEISESRRVAHGMNEPKIGTVPKAKAFSVLDTLMREGKPLEVEVQVIALGNDVAFVSLPGEIFVELGLAIKKASPFKYTFIAELANGSIGYIPNRSAYAEGNYEVVSARCAAGSGELLVDAAVRLLQELKPGEALTR